MQDECAVLNQSRQWQGSKEALQVREQTLQKNRAHRNAAPQHTRQRAPAFLVAVVVNSKHALQSAVPKGTSPAHRPATKRKTALFSPAPCCMLAEVVNHQLASPVYLSCLAILGFQLSCKAVHLRDDVAFMVAAYKVHIVRQQPLVGHQQGQHFYTPCSSVYKVTCRGKS